MCLIVRGHIGDLLNLDLASAQRSNNDGWGIHTKKRLVYSFATQEKDIVKFLADKPKNIMATIHFRFATHGDVNLSNAHPFALGNGEFLMHNGILYGDHFDHPTQSDTSRLADILKDAGPAARAYILESLAESDYYTNRFCILQGTSWTKFGNWHYDKSTKTWHSNRALLGVVKSKIQVGKQRYKYDHATNALIPIVVPKTPGNYLSGHYDDEYELSEATYYAKQPPASVTAMSDMYDDDILDINDPFHVSER